MPVYNQSHVTQRYEHSANPPLLDKVVFTIDHIHQGGPGLYSTYDVVKFLTDRQIPVTIFIQCTDPANLCPADRRNTQDVYDLNPNLVTLGTHSLSPANSQSAQAGNHNLIRNVISDVTGSSPVIMSYHGANAGPENGISYAGIRYARGIKSFWSAAQNDNPLNTPVMGLGSVSAAFDFIRLRNQAGLSATLFVHSAELTNGSTKKTVFDTIIKAVMDRKLQAMPYLSAMQSDYSSVPVTPPPIPQPEPPIIPPITSPCPLNFFTNNRIVQYLRINIRDGINGVYQVSEIQNFLNEIGLDSGVSDGIFGGKTKLAVVGYQIIRGLTPDGVVGPNTRASINAYCD